MLQKLFFLICKILFGRWLSQKKKSTSTYLKAEGVKNYLRVMQGLRIGTLGLVSFIIVIQMFTFGLALMGGAAIFLTNWPLESKIQAIFILGGCLFALPFLGLLILFSERLWYKASGAQKMVNDILESQ